MNAASPVIITGPDPVAVQACASALARLGYRTVNATDLAWQTLVTINPAFPVGPLATRVPLACLRSLLGDPAVRARADVQRLLASVHDTITGAAHPDTRPSAVALPVDGTVHRLTGPATEASRADGALVLWVYDATSATPTGGPAPHPCDVVLPVDGPDDALTARLQRLLTAHAA